MHCQQLRWIAALLALLAGCSRSHYRVTADADSYAILREKSACLPWELPPDYQVEPHLASRMALPQPLDHPLLPQPSPQLYAYELPEFQARPANRFFGPGRDGLALSEFNLAQSQLNQSAHPRRLPPVHPGGAVQFVSHLVPIAATDEERLQWAHLRWLQPESDPGVDPEIESPRGQVALGSEPIPPTAWEDIPTPCRRRMFDFQSLREQFQQSYGRDVLDGETDQAPRLALEDIIDLALLNSREYQQQKEQLYQVALRLTLQRYDYQLKFTPTGNGTDVNYTHNRAGGTTVNTLSTPTTTGVNKMLLTGGDLLARFANNVLLTFNGPQGFAADVGSELLLDLSQPVFQRDIRFEALTQAERDVVYAARDFARFRREFFNDLASQYYNLIRQYRQIEIDSQNYFSLVRAFREREAEYSGGFSSRVDLDQVEQNVLGGRSRLIQTCTNLEQQLDNLKLRMGIPTELPLNIDLTELQQLTLRDRLSVTADLIQRVRERLALEIESDDANRVVLLSTTLVLIERVLETEALQAELGLGGLATQELREQQARIQVESSRLESEYLRVDREAALNVESPRPSIIFQRTMDLVDTLLELVEHQTDFAELTGRTLDEVAMFRMQTESLRGESEEVRESFRQLISEEGIRQLPQLVVAANDMLMRTDALVAALDRFNNFVLETLTPQEELERTRSEARNVLGLADSILPNIAGGLVPIDVEVDDAMMTALVLRFELMNQRGFVADDWRQIKLAADELRSVLDLSASQRIRTRPDVNRVFDFTWDESRTDLRLTFDAPLNRRAERNSYRSAQLAYQRSLRSLSQLEDSIKLEVRNSLRSLELDREQYQIAVASAALAFERVVSTRLEQRLGLGGSARDFLEAQDDYTAALSNVASRHIQYIIDRMQLFLDLELLTVGDDGFWESLYDEELQVEPYFQLPPWALPAFGTLPHVWHSKEIHSMLHVPPGNAMIHNHGQTVESESAYEDEELIVPLPEPQLLMPTLE